VLAAMALVLLGLGLTFLRHPEYRSSPGALDALLSADAPRSAMALLAALPSFRGEPFVLVGLMLLVATPIVRVAVTAALLWRRGERTLAQFGGAVLVLLLISFAVGSAAL